MKSIYFMISVAVILCIEGSRMLAQDVGYFPDTTYKIVQLTGDTDTTRRIPTVSRTNTNASISMTDLGSSFEHKGRLHFLFGDTPSLAGGSGVDDFLAWDADNASQPKDVRLEVFKNGSSFSPLRIAANGGGEVPRGAFEVPSAGISINGAIYIVATTDHKEPPGPTMGRSVMAVSYDDGLHFNQLYDLSTSRFINVSMVEVDGHDYPDILPPKKCVLIWGSGDYRKSEVRMAYVPSDQIGNKSALRYCDLRGATPLWNSNEAAAVPLFPLSLPDAGVGELSVAYCQQLAKWIMLYYTYNEIHMRSANAPWGPWSNQATVIVDRDRDKAFGQYMHRPLRDILGDPLPGSPDPQGIYGGVYGPYLIPRFFRGDQNRVTLVYAMSTWNPYQTVLMQSDIGYPDHIIPPEIITSSVTLPGDTGAGWSVSGNFLRTFTRNGVPYVSSFAFSGDADMGVAHYGFAAGCSDQALEFSVHGGDAEVVLIEQTQSIPASIANVPAFYQTLKAGGYGPVVECMIGPQNNFDNAPDLKVRWDLRRRRGKAMRLFVIDWLNRPWGFISVSQVTRFFTSGSEPANLYVDGASTSGPFLGTPSYPFQTVTTGYAAATAPPACSTNVLVIRAGNYPETFIMNKPVTLKAEGGATTIGQ